MSLQLLTWCSVKACTYHNTQAGEYPQEVAGKTMDTLASDSQRIEPMQLGIEPELHTSCPGTIGDLHTYDKDKRYCKADSIQ